MGSTFAIRGRSTVGSFAARKLGGRFAGMVGGTPDYGELHALLQNAGRNVQRATEVLGELMRSWPDGAEKRQDLVDLEHENDAVTHDIVHHLHARLAVPFERSDVLALASSLDDVVDYAEEVADFLALYRVEAPMDQAIELTDVLSAAGGVVAVALDALDDPGSAIPHLNELDRLEHEGDRILREGLTALFDVGVDPMVVIRWKDIFERVEQAIDACNHVAHILRGIAVKST